MKKSQGGFALLELIFIVVAIVLVGFAGYFVWHGYHAAPVESSKKSSDTPVHAGWVTYKSTHSSVQFSYPASWKLTQEKVSGFTLESIKLEGPNGFQMEFELATNHVNPAMSCAKASFGTAVLLGNHYEIIPTLDNKNSNNIDSITLLASQGADGRGDCGLSFYPNPVGKTMGFVFSGYYLQPANEGGGVHASKPADSYFSLSEIETAKTIFANFKQ